MQLRALTSTELAQMERTRDGYCAMWGRLRNVPERTFEGGPEDIHALGFIDYEAGEHPEGIAGATVIFGGVLVKTGIFEWMIADDLHLALVSTQEYPRVTILPNARLLEIAGSSWPPGNGGRFDWLLEEIVVRMCAGGVDGDQLRPVLALVDRHETIYWDAAGKALDVIRTGGVPGAG